MISELPKAMLDTQQTSHRQQHHSLTKAQSKETSCKLQS